MKEILGVKLYSLAEVGEMLGVQRATASKYIQEGKLRARTIGGRKFVSEDSLRDFLNNTDHKPDTETTNP